MYGKEPIDFQQCRFQNGRLAAILDFVISGLCRWRAFWNVTQACFGISISNFMCMLFVSLGRSLLIFRDVPFKMSAWWPYWLFQFPGSNFCLALNIMVNQNFSSTLQVCMERSLLVFRYVTFKMAAWWPYWIFWFSCSNLSLAVNFKSKLLQHISCVYW